MHPCKTKVWFYTTSQTQKLSFSEDSNYLETIQPHGKLTQVHCHRNGLYSVTKFSTSSRSLVWALCDTGAKLGPWPANSSSPRTGTGRPPRASSCQTDTEPSEPEVQLSRARMTPPGGLCPGKKCHISNCPGHGRLRSWGVTDAVTVWLGRKFGHCPSPFWGENTNDLSTSLSCL